MFVQHNFSIVGDRHSGNDFLAFRIFYDAVFVHRADEDFGKRCIRIDRQIGACRDKVIGFVFAQHGAGNDLTGKRQFFVDHRIANKTPFALRTADIPRILDIHIREHDLTGTGKLRIHHARGIRHCKGTVVGDGAECFDRCSGGDIHCTICADRGVFVQAQSRVVLNINDTGLVDDEVFTLNCAIVAFCFVGRAIRDDETSGDIRTIVTGNFGANCQHIGTVKGRRAVDDEITGIEGIVAAIVVHFFRRIAGNIQNTILRNVQIAEFRNGFINIQGVLGISHRRSFFCIRIVESGADPTGVGSTRRADLSIVFHRDSDTFRGINIVIRSIVSTDADLECAVVDHRSADHVVTAGKTDIRAIQLGIRIKGDILHVNDTLAREVCRNVIHTSHSHRAAVVDSYRSKLRSVSHCKRTIVDNCRCADVTIVSNERTTIRITICIGRICILCIDLQITIRFYCCAIFNNHLALSGNLDVNSGNSVTLCLIDSQRCFFTGQCVNTVEISHAVFVSICANQERRTHGINNINGHLAVVCHIRIDHRL